MPKEKKLKGADVTREEIEQEIISIVKGEKQAYETATVFVTDRIAFDIKNLIKTLRKNYWGIFDVEKDPVTGKRKTFTPLTEVTVDNWVKSSDVDAKDMNFRAKKKNSIGLTALVRTVVKNWMDENYFGETLDATERQGGIDGSHIWKTLEVKDEKTNRMVMKRFDVDILNAYFDFTSPSIQEAYRFTERALKTEAQVKGMEGWLNTKQVSGSVGLHRIESAFTNSTVSQTNSGEKMVDVWELWGMIPEWVITGKKEEWENNGRPEIPGRLVVSGLESPGKELVHLAERNKRPDGMKPYEEIHIGKKIPGRWLARGPAESVLMLQAWINTIVNIRINRSYVSQLGIFKIKRGKGITPRKISRLAANGAIIVENMDDIEQFVMQEASQASYLDEDKNLNWAQRVTQTFEAVTGESLPASTPATNAILAARNANSTFVMVKKSIGFFLQRWMKRQALPIIMRNLTVGDVIRHTGEIQEMRDIFERIVNKEVYEKMDEINKANQLAFEEGRFGELVFVDEALVERERQNAITKLRKSGKDLFIDLLDDIDVTQFDVQVFITNEEVDKGVLVKNLITALQLVPQHQETIIRYVFDLMGLDMNQLDDDDKLAPTQGTEQAGQVPQGAQGGQALGALIQQIRGAQSQNPVEQTIEANTQ